MQGRQQQKRAGAIPVNVYFPSGVKQMYLGGQAIQSYEKQGIRVRPAPQQMEGGVRTIMGRPQIERIINQSAVWSNNPPPQLSIGRPQNYLKPNTKTNSNFGGLGANPWNPIDAIGNLFGMSPQEKPASQWLPQRQSNIINPQRPTYNAFAQGQYQQEAIYDSRAGFTQSMAGTQNFNPTDTIKNLLSNEYAVYAGLGIGGLLVLKIIMGGGGR
jgi:hypothetical protein